MEKFLPSFPPDFYLLLSLKAFLFSQAAENVTGGTEWGQEVQLLCSCMEVNYDWADAWQ